MAKPTIHVVKDTRGWAVRAGVAGAAGSVHATRAEAEEVAQRVARDSGGEVAIHEADGRIRDSDAAPRTRSVRRAPAEGHRTTLRVPSELIVAADRLAAELQVSRNDALIRLATRGAELQERQRSIAAKRDARWAAVMQHASSPDPSRFPSPEEARTAILDADDGDPE